MMSPQLLRKIYTTDLKVVEEKKVYHLDAYNILLSYQKLSNDYLCLALDINKRSGVLASYCNFLVNEQRNSFSIINI